MASRRNPQINIIANQAFREGRIGKTLTAVAWPAEGGWWVGVRGQEPRRHDEEVDAVKDFFAALVKASEADGG